MAFTETERTDIRRHCGYPAFGVGNAAFQNWRFYQVYGLLEFRLNWLSGAEEAVVRQYLGTLSQLEEAIPGVGTALDTEQAANWTRNPRELSERRRLFDDWRRRLCGFLGVPSGPGLGPSAPVLVV